MGTLSLFGFKEQNDFLLEALTEETVHSSAIEGERLNRDSVRSSVAKHLGLEYEGLPPTDHYIEGVVQIMIDATCHFGEPLTKKDYLLGMLPYFQRVKAVFIKSELAVGEWEKSLCRWFQGRWDDRKFTMKHLQVAMFRA